MTIIASVIFYENNKYYPQVFLDECLYKLLAQTRTGMQKLSCMMKKQKFLYFTYLFINDHCIIDSC